MAAALDVESDGSVRDHFKIPPFDLGNLRYDVSRSVSPKDIDKETLETLYDQLLREIYKQARVTGYPRGHVPNCHETTVKMLMTGIGLIGTDSFTKSPSYRTFHRHAACVTGIEQGLPAALEGCIPCPHAPILLSLVALTIFRMPPTGKPNQTIVSMLCNNQVVKWL